MPAAMLQNRPGAGRDDGKRPGLGCVAVHVAMLWCALRPVVDQSGCQGLSMPPEASHGHARRRSRDAGRDGKLACKLLHAWRE
ncbi:hypothetical protein [Thiomonas sp.]